MSSKRVLLAAPVLAVVAWAWPVSAVSQQPQTVAFTNVNVIPLDHEGVEHGRTVLVCGGRVAEVGSSDEIKIPGDAVVIDGAGQYLVPGLTDAHVHITGTPSPLLRTRDNFGDAPL